MALPLANPDLVLRLEPPGRLRPLQLDGSRIEVAGGLVHAPQMQWLGRLHVWLLAFYSAGLSAGNAGSRFLSLQSRDREEGGVALHPSEHSKRVLFQSHPELCS